ncbi:hypothetical protein [Sphingomonas sp. dw_22]|uniref:hypothetical protein n=1 Tax=Sphingomonas sp. dw_22 TaxID=2721175 RepID=UPI001BD3326A|nr:hypothetical protein [Sphingomonas sp. dw_22]
MASGLDARFVEAGGALAQAYQIVETLVKSLEGVTSALDREAADAAVQDMRAIADRLTRLPAMQSRRQEALVTIGGAGEALRTPMAQFHRTLRFLRICGLNIKVAAAGAAEFSGFADTMFEKIDVAEEQMSSFGQEIDGLSSGISEALEAEKLLADECTRVIPEVPMRLDRDALALQDHQARLGELAVRIAQVAREIRTRLATALGALQIGDITRQRLEHVVTGLSTMDAALREASGLAAEDITLIEEHILALLAAQAADAVEEFRSQARILAQSLRAIGPQATALLALKDDGKDGGGAQGDGDDDHVLHVLERSIEEVRSVTGRLQQADELSDRLGTATSATAESLGRRIAAVQRVKNDVQQMAWNTDLRCRRMGADGQGLAMIATEIRNFSNHLEMLTNGISGTFEQLVDAAAEMRAQAESAGKVDAGKALTASLDCVRDGGDRMREGLSGLDRDAATVGDILRQTTENVDCDAEIGDALGEAVTQLAAAAGDPAMLPEAPPAALGEILAAIHASYTMASEREVHKRFALAGGVAEMEEAPAQGDDDDDDDGLF